jgi:hypothetical protein
VGHGIFYLLIRPVLLGFVSDMAIHKFSAFQFHFEPQEQQFRKCTHGVTIVASPREFDRC